MICLLLSLARSDRARRRGLLARLMYALSNVCMYLAVNYVIIFSYIIALSMTSLAQVLSDGADTNILAIYCY